MYRLLARLFKKKDTSESAVATKKLASLVCKECGRELPSIINKLIREKYILCAECTIAQNSDWKSSKDEYELFFYSMPWNDYIASYANGMQWLPQYQAYTGSLQFPRSISGDEIPPDAMYANITTSTSEHGSFTHRSESALIAFWIDVELIFAFVPQN